MSGVWNDIKEVSDEGQNVKKFIYTKDTAVAESVLYKYPDYETRTVICCSVQSGCPVGCRFCGSGDYFVRNLTADEIVSQVEYSLAMTEVDPVSIDKLQIMYMSMGEPLLNLKALLPAIDRLTKFYPNAAQLISTTGPKLKGLKGISYDDLVTFAEKHPMVGLQFSVHESTDEARNKLIPFKEKLTLEQISQMGWLFSMRTGRKAFFNYCAHDGNTSNEDAERLSKLFPQRHFNATISVICERNEGLPATNEHQRNLAIDFSAKLVARGFDVRVFDPAGQDTIGGGCGQLWYVQDWMKNNPDKARPSCGNGLTTVHVPIKPV